MSTIPNLPKLPWSYETNTSAGSREGSGHVYLVDANGRKIAVFWGKPEERIATAQLVIEAAEAAAGRVP